MSTVLGCIADDFTGATDLAGLLARSGAAVTLRIGLPSGPPTATSGIEVIALKIRNAPAAEAVEASLAALGWLQAAGATRFYWKYCSTFDSTPQGNIGPVAEALMQALGTDQTVYCPAFPDNARSVYMGRLFVGRQPLAESPMKDHPLTPMRDSSLERLLAPQVRHPVGLVDLRSVVSGPGAIREELDRLRGEGVAHVIVDAISDGDLAAISEACRDMRLTTGGSALAMGLPGLLLDPAALEENRAAAGLADVGPRRIVLSGSCSQMTRRQVSRYLETHPGYRLDPLELAGAGVAPALDWLDRQDPQGAPLIYATAEPDAVRLAQDRLGVQEAGAIVEAALARIAAHAARSGVGRFVVAGGETLGAVTQALGVARLDLGAEICPGVPWTFAESGGARIALALKSGNFGGVSFFEDAFAALEQA